MDQGFLFFQGSTELNLMAAGARQFLDALVKSSESPETPALD
jgi:hypothetical protein